MPSIGGPPVVERSSGTACADDDACPKARSGKQTAAARKTDFFI
jgi:hypothetical protein